MLQDKRVLAIIPARGGSKTVPRKNLRLIKGKSLLTRTIETAQLSSLIDRIVVSSEDVEILEMAQRSGADVPFVRPLELAQDETPGSEPILHALTQLPHYDYVIVLQVTSPLRNCDDIDGCLQFCLQQNAPACVSIAECETSPHWMFTLNHHSALLPILSGPMPLRRQELPTTYSLNGAIYVAKTYWFLQNKQFLSPETIGYLMPRERSLDIDTEFDLHLLEMYLSKDIAIAI